MSGPIASTRSTTSQPPTFSNLRVLSRLAVDDDEDAIEGTSVMRLRQPTARQAWVLSSPTPISDAILPSPASSIHLPFSSALLDTSMRSEAASEALQKPPRAIPMYMHALDLAFAAAFTVCADWMKLATDGHGSSSTAVLHFFTLFLPLARLWDHANALFNRFDAEDVISEIVVVVLMSGVMMFTINVRACFFEALLEKPDIPPDPRMIEDSCRYFLYSFGGSRVVLSLYTIYIGWCVRDARPRVWRELMLVGAVVTAAVALERWIAPSDDSTWAISNHAQAALLGASAVDTALFHVDDLLPRATHAPTSAPSTKRTGGCLSRVLRLRVPVDATYLIRRHERMVVIAMGTLVADAIRATLDDVSRFDDGALLVCLSTPCIALLLKGALRITSNPGLSPAFLLPRPSLASQRAACLIVPRHLL